MSSTFILRPGDSGPGGTSPNPFDDQGLPAGSSIRIARLPLTNYIPPEGEEFTPAAYVALPAIGASAVIVQFLVPEGRNGIVNRFANVFVGGGFTEGSGGVVWQLFQDFTVGAVVPNFDNIVSSLGSVNNAKVLNGIRIKENQLVTLVVKNVSIVVSGQLVGGLLGGFTYPIDLEESMGF